MSYANAVWLLLWTWTISFFCFYRRNRKDQPHVRGEKQSANGKKSTIPGSTPRTWGKVIVIVSSAISLRITPTCVGKRKYQHFVRSVQQDQPHVRGEKPYTLLLRVLQSGSTPRTWGKECHFYRDRCLSGINPTYVGKSSGY